LIRVTTGTARDEMSTTNDLISTYCKRYKTHNYFNSDQSVEIF